MTSHGVYGRAEAGALRAPHLRCELYGMAGKGMGEIEDFGSEIALPHSRTPALTHSRTLPYFPFTITSFCHTLAHRPVVSVSTSSTAARTTGSSSVCAYSAASLLLSASISLQ